MGHLLQRHHRRPGARQHGTCRKPQPKIPQRGRATAPLAAGRRALRPEATLFLNDLGCDAPAGERCAVYLRDRPGLRAALEPYAAIHRLDDVWSAGWFGGPPADPTFRHRTGDLLALPRAGLQLLWRGSVHELGAEPYRGGHGGLTAEEMLVPLVAVRV